MKEVIIYTDGACSGNPGPGGWAALLRYGTVERTLSGAAPLTTNNRMELTAAVEALRALREPCRVVLHADSQYVVKGMTEWITGWKQRGWKNAQKKPVENRDLWEALDAAATPHRVEWRWVKGHASDPDNNRVDALAVEALKALVAGEGVAREA